MGGASIALPLDAVAAASSPAGIAFAPSSFALGMQVSSIHERAYTTGLSWRVAPHAEINLGYELNPPTALRAPAPARALS